MASKTARRNLVTARQAAERTALAAERKAVAGWHELAGALDVAADRTQDIAGDARKRARGIKREATKRASDLTHEASRRTTDLTREATRRTSAAKDALAGRTPPKRHRFTLMAALAGVGLGALAAVVVRRYAEMRNRNDLADLEARVADTVDDTTVPAAASPATTTAGMTSITPVSSTTDTTAITPAPSATPTSRKTPGTDPETARLNGRSVEVPAKDSPNR